MSKKNRYFLNGNKEIYIFNYNEMEILRYRFKPFNKRVKFRSSLMFHNYKRFFLLSSVNFKYTVPEKYLKNFGCGVYKELFIGKSYIL